MNYVGKVSVVTLAIKAGLMCHYDGEIFNEARLEENLAKLLQEKGYKMSPQRAMERVMDFSSHRYEIAYG